MTESTAGEGYRATVVGPGIQAERDVDLQMAMAIVQVMFGTGALAPADVALVTPRSAGRVGPSDHNQRLSIREFLESVGGRNIPAKIAAIARYMRDHEAQNEFSRDDIRVRFRSAGEVMPGNFPRDFQKTLQAGWIAEDPQNRGRFYVTRRGDEAIDQKFEGAPSSPTRSRRRRRSFSAQPAEGDSDQ
jgi:hypothetical protein